MRQCEAAQIAPEENVRQTMLVQFTTARIRVP